MRATAMAAIEPSQDAKVLGEHMLEAAEVNQTILEETVESALNGRVHESGRTACGDASNIQHPRARMPTAVELSGCSVGHLTGFWHTHVTRDQFQDPEHSLPDMANVLFEDAGVSIVTGVNTSQVMYSPADPGPAQQAFRDVLGLDVNSTREVKDAIVRGQVPDPTGARSRMFSQLSRLFDRRSTRLVDAESIRENMHAIPPSMSAPGEAEIAYELVECALAHQDGGLDTPIRRIHDRARRGSDTLWHLTRKVASAGFDEAIGVIVGTVISKRLFG